MKYEKSALLRKAPPAVPGMMLLLSVAVVAGSFAVGAAAIDATGPGQQVQGGEQRAVAADGSSSPVAGTIELPVTRSYEGWYRGELVLVEITIDRYVEEGAAAGAQPPARPAKADKYLWEIVVTTLEINRTTVERNGIRMLRIKRSKRDEVVFWGRNTSLSPVQRPREYISMEEAGFLVEVASSGKDEVQFEFMTHLPTGTAVDGGAPTAFFYYNREIDPQQALRLKD